MTGLSYRNSAQFILAANVGPSRCLQAATISYGKYNRFVLMYTVKVYQMPSEQRDKWIKNFSEANIVTSEE